MSLMGQMSDLGPPWPSCSGYLWMIPVPFDFDLLESAIKNNNKYL
jgi:hypothetical protein